MSSFPQSEQNNKQQEETNQNHPHRHLSRANKVNKLRELLNNGECNMMPCVYDGHSAKLVEEAGFPLTLMTGFGVSATYGVPDTQLISAAEMYHNASVIAGCLKSIPCIGDG